MVQSTNRIYGNGTKEPPSLLAVLLLMRSTPSSYSNGLIKGTDATVLAISAKNSSDSDHVNAISISRQTISEMVPVGNATYT
jgi:hypothetical protein